MSSEALEIKQGVVRHKPNTLGRVRLHDENTNQIILIPSPSEDPDDPLNWYDLQSSFDPVMI